MAAAILVPLLPLQTGLIAAILFYKLVERRHKIWLAKALTVLMALGGITIGVLYLRDRAEEGSQQRMRLAIKVTLLPLPPSTPPTAVPDSTNPFNDIPDRGLDQLRFEVCNTFQRATRAFDFDVAGRMRGHSTESRIEASSKPDWRNSTTFTSDRILSPSQCDTLTYYGSFLRYDEYLVHTTSVEYLDH